MSVFVMAAGKGTRLAPLTDVLPKPAIPVANEPVMGRLLRLLARQGFQRVVCNIAYKADVMERVFGDGTAYGIDIVWSRETQPLGTSGGMKFAEQELRSGDEPVVVLSGDGLHDIDVAALLREHRESDALVTIALTRVDDPSEYGVAVIDDTGRITGFQEKPAAHDAASNLANTGIYVINPEVFDRLPAAGAFSDFGSEVFPSMLADGHHIRGVEISGYWNDVGGLDALRRGNLDVVSGVLADEHPVDLSGDQHLIHPAADVGVDVTLLGTCVVGPGATIGAGAHIADSVVLPGAHIPAGAVLAAGIFGDAAALGTWADNLGSNTALTAG